MNMKTTALSRIVLFNIPVVFSASFSSYRNLEYLRPAAELISRSFNSPIRTNNQVLSRYGSRNDQYDFSRRDLETIRSVEFPGVGRESSDSDSDYDREVKREYDVHDEREYGVHNEREYGVHDEREYDWNNKESEFTPSTPRPIQTPTQSSIPTPKPRILRFTCAGYSIECEESKNGLESIKYPYRCKIDRNTYSSFNSKRTIYRTSSA